MKRHFCAIALFFFAAVLSVHAESSLLPDHFGAWQAAGPATPVKPSELGPKWDRWIEGEKILAESGITRIEDRAYKNGADELGLRLYRFKDPSSAFEFYTFAVLPGMKPLGLGQNSAIQQDDARLLIGNFVVQAGLSEHLAPSILQDVINALKPRADQTPLPPIRNYLPLEGRIFGSEKYAFGPDAFRRAAALLERGEFASLSSEAGFSSGAEAMFARYRTGKDDAVLLLIEYPTPQLAEQHLHHLEQALSTSAKQAGTTIERKGSLLSLLLRPSSAVYGTALRNAVNYETQVTWNEPTHTITDPPWATILGKIIIITMLFMVVAVVLGAAFGGVRVLTKMFLPGKVFDRPEKMEVLQLGLSGKRIDPRDFY
jgi:uncharacterized protein DUF6599